MTIIDTYDATKFCPTCDRERPFVVEVRADSESSICARCGWFDEGDDDYIVYPWEDQEDC